MLKKLTVLALLLGLAFGIMMLSTQSSVFVVEDSVAVDASPGAIWATVQNERSWPAWWPGVEEARVRPAWSVGAELLLTLKGRPAEGPARVTAVLPPRRLGWSRPGVLGSTSGTLLELLPAEGGTRVAMETKIVGPQAFLARFTGAEEFHAYQQQVLERLKGEVDGVLPATDER